MQFDQKTKECLDSIKRALSKQSREEKAYVIEELIQALDEQLQELTDELRQERTPDYWPLLDD